MYTARAKYASKKMSKEEERGKKLTGNKAKTATIHMVVYKHQARHGTEKSIFTKGRRAIESVAGFEKEGQIAAAFGAGWSKSVRLDAEFPTCLVERKKGIKHRTVQEPAS